MTEGNNNDNFKPESEFKIFSAEERIEEAHQLIDQIANQYTKVQPVGSRLGFSARMNGKSAGSINKQVSELEKWIAEAYRFFKDEGNQDITLAFAAEWVLDNYYIIRQNIYQIKEDLSPGFFDELPKLIEGKMSGYPRIYAIARNILAYQNLLLDSIALENLLIEIQKKIQLTMGEIWALPIFLRFSLTEFLAEALVLMIDPKQAPDLAKPLALLPGLEDPLVDKFSNHGGVINSNGIANIILSFRAISELNWKDFFETVSCLEQILRHDPAGVYANMDFRTRDLYRGKIEKLAHASGYHECDLAKFLIRAANGTVPEEGNLDMGHELNSSNLAPMEDDQNAPPQDQAIHIGEFLLGKYQTWFEEKIGYHPNAREAAGKWVLKHATPIYLSSVLGLSFIIFILLVWIAAIPQILQSGYQALINESWIVAKDIATSPLMIIIILLVGIVMIIPVLTITTSLINWLITLIFPPRTLPKMNYRMHLPQDERAMVVIPGLISTNRDLDSLVSQLEMHYLRNQEPGFQFGLLTDFGDAGEETRPEDEDLLEYGLKKIAALNQKYKSKPLYSLDTGKVGIDLKARASDRFFFFHRRRLWNPSEGKWMGWERKRGKLHELNLLLRGSQNHTFVTINDRFRKNPNLFTHIKYIITLDADTILPIGAAKRLVGAMAHPLNKPVFSEQNGRVVSGYTILQPRMEIHPKSSNQSWFTRIFSGDAGLDLYSLAVSDAYQDLFGEGIYVGKGIYDLDAFERSVDAHIPENTILSHDLLEGNMGRAGLVSDITMVEEYPPSYLTMVLRQRRWIRGDWQLLPWLFKSNRKKLGFNLLDRWKIFDNLRRSLLAPALLFIFVFGLLFLPRLASLWTLTLVIALGVPLLTGLTRSAFQIMGGESLRVSLQPLGWIILRWILAISFIVYEAYIALDAILTTLYRLLISHKNMLQWTTAAQTARIFNLRKRGNVAWQKMTVSVLFAVILTVGIQLLYNMASVGFAPTLIAAAVVLLFWVLSPLVVYWINRPIVEQVDPLNAAQLVLLRQVARRTWGFFEHFVGPEDHWLPPDHYQETPGAKVAHRTSPTNIGLLLTSTLAAYDLGFLNQYGLVTRWMMTMDALKQLERYRGHFLNWYNTLNLEPLNPRYVSTVDSGNLAASFIVVSQACQQMESAPVFRWELWQGYLDSLNNLVEILTAIRSPEFRSEIQKITRQISLLKSEIQAIRNHPQDWYPLFLKVKGKFWENLSTGLMRLIDVSRNAFDQERLAQLNEITIHLGRHQEAVQRDIIDLLPWVPLFSEIPAALQSDDFASLMAELSQALPLNLKLNEIQNCVQSALPIIDRIAQEMEGQISNSPFEGGINSSTPDVTLAASRDWLNHLSLEIQRAQGNVIEILEHYATIREAAERYTREMDFRFLYGSQRRVFHIGFNLDAGLLDKNFYDLLASEARIASIIAIAKHDVPQSHWVYLSRPVTRVEEINTLLSWSGTMFEYLMPPLFLRSYPGTLLADSARGAVKHQIAYGQSKRVPWGISESGFYRFDAGQSYQYRAFGVPGLGFKRGLGDDLVIAPYASLLAVGIDPQAVLKNIRKLIAHHMFGLYGFYESLDFTSGRLLINEKAAVVAEYMAHHQGMALMAINNFLHDDIMVRRMHSNALINSVDLLLQEQVPQATTPQDQNLSGEQGTSRFEKSETIISPWVVPIQTSIPQLHLISNGILNVVISNMGGGYSSWRDTDLTRWQADAVLDPWGTWIYIQELENGKATAEKTWSASNQPLPGRSEDSQVTFHSHMAAFRRSFEKIVSVMEVTVAPEDPIEIRRIHVVNNSNRTRNLRITSYGEVILTSQASDAQHPAFNKLFIESEFVAELNLQIFTRRPRSNQDAPILMAHMCFAEKEELVIQSEADRQKFIGRSRTLRNPQALFSGTYLSGSSGATLDPIFSLGAEITLAAHEHKQIVYLTFAAESRDEILEIARRYHSWELIERSFNQSDINSQSRMNKEGIDSDFLQDILKTFSALVFPNKATRALEEVLTKNRLGQSALWRFGISGDFPILLVSLAEIDQLDILREALMVYKFLRIRRYKIDLVILNQQTTNYGAEMNELVQRLIRKMESEDFLNLRGGIYILYQDQIGSDESTLIMSAARVVLKGERDGLHSQLPDYAVQVLHLPEFTPSLVITYVEPIARVLPADLQFNNGYGGFSANGEEYYVDNPPGKPTPAPWVNVIGYAGFGFMVSESGSQTTWAINSGENRLTPWSNDPVRDPSGEVLYLRDEETGEFWSATPQPASKDHHFTIRHAAGYSIFEHQSHGLEQHLAVYASPNDPVKIIRLKVTNLLDRTRRITATQYVEWVLGTNRSLTSAFILPEYDHGTECLLATNPYSTEFSQRTAFLAASKPIHGMTADRAEFLGRAGSLEDPIALKRLGLEKRITTGEDPCAVLQIHMDIRPNSTEEIYFILGQGKDREEALDFVHKYHDHQAVERAFTDTKDYWENLLGAIQVETPDAAMNLMLNRWSLYQALSCRIWGRTAFYQSSGAYGFRDQLQDVLALLSSQPALARRQILRAAAHQFEEGDVLHWWHPPAGRGVRTHFSDDLLWLPYVVSFYIQVTGDSAILDEEVQFLQGALLAEGEDERYGLYETSQRGFSLYEHCLRAIQKGCTWGIHRLPLFGTGDWNDGLNRVGEKGKGESIWLAWFLVDVLNRFAQIIKLKGDTAQVEEYQQRARDYAQAVEENGWDGAWYRRGYYDNGRPLGSSQNMEGQIDAIAQSWAIMSAGGNRERSLQAMNSVRERLILPDERLMLLFTPPFDQTPQNPGYIKGYLPGIRENGSQYTHAATWTAWAFRDLGEGTRSGDLFNLLNPIYQADSKDKADIYRVEPYVVCADIYSKEPYVRRGGWTWYTGSAAWFYRLGIEAILGFQKEGETLRFDPVIPAWWDRFKLTYRYGKSSYMIKVENPQHVESGVAQVLVDGNSTEKNEISLDQNGGEHIVTIIMG